MENTKELRNLIEQAQNIQIFASKEREETQACALALFYTLKELKKNVNLEIDYLPEKLKFLSPSLSHISQPKDFRISIPKDKANVSQISYEKDDNGFKVYLKIEEGNIRKKDISFCFAQIKPDLIITIGIKGKNELKETNLPILNIDNRKENEKFGKINIVESDKSLSEIVFSVINAIDGNLIRKEVSTSLLAALILSSSDSQKEGLLPQSADLLTKGAEGKEILENIYKNNLNN